MNIGTQHQSQILHACFCAVRGLHVPSPAVVIPTQDTSAWCSTCNIQSTIARKPVFGAIAACASIFMHRYRRQTSAFQYRTSDLRVPKRASSQVIKKLLSEKPEKETLEEVLAALHQQEKEDMAQLDVELANRAPSEQDQKLQALKNQQAQLRAAMQKKRQKRKQETNIQLNYASRRPLEPPQPWQLVLHSDSGRWYYYNQATGITTWDPPSEQRPPEPPSPWQLVLDMSSGRWYYHNLDTNATAWQLPPAVSIGNSSNRGTGARSRK